MRSVKFILAAGAASLMSTAAFSADMAIAPPPQMYAPQPVVEDFGGWYLRGDIGFSNQKTKGLENVLNNAPGTTVQTINSDFDTAGIFGVGVGYRFNNWFRADVTGQYRGKANYHGLEIVNFNGVPAGTDEYRGSKSEWLVLANAYVDLGTWWCITPFIGAGVGMSRNTISNFTDINTPNAGVAFGDAASKWNFAWAAHAGLAYKVTPGMTMELGYSYVNLGDAVTGDLRTYTGVNAVYNPTTFKNLTSHDLKLGVRWELEAAPVYLPPPPLIRKG